MSLKVSQIVKQYFLFGLNIILVLFQIYLVFEGTAKYFDKYVNPVFLLIVNLCMVVITFLSLLNRRNEVRKPKRQVWVWLAFMIATVITYYFYRQGFHAYIYPDKYSDVLPQLEALYDRFAKGEQPYYPLAEIGHHPFPVYMPAHWIILWLPKLLHLDIRWVGLLFLILSVAVFLFYYLKQSVHAFSAIIMVALFCWAIVSYYYFDSRDIFVTLETPIAAYYLLLAAALISRQLWLVVLAIVLCLLSRYTLVFWLPLFALLLFWERSFKTSLWVWSVIIVSLFVFYIIPFILKSPDILTTGLAYHNKAAVDEWHGYGEPPISWSQESGIYFAPHLKRFFSGNAYQQVYKTRILQASLMIMLNIIGGIVYRRFRKRIHYMDFGLIALYCFLMFFYLFGALTYRYYLITMFVLSVAMCAISGIYANDKKH